MPSIAHADKQLDLLHAVQHAVIPLPQSVTLGLRGLLVNDMSKHQTFSYMSDTRPLAPTRTAVMLTDLISFTVSAYANGKRTSFNVVHFPFRSWTY